MDAHPDPQLIVLATGGTISGKAADAADNIAYTAGLVGVDELLAALPAGPGQRLRCTGEQVAQVDSKDMDTAIWIRLAQRCAHHLAQAAVRGIVITHGTDTMEETAYLLHALLGAHGARGKPVVLTGAMRPATALCPDGPQNMRDALAVAAHPDARGVMVCMAGAIFGALDVQKVHPYRRNAFDASDAGPLGLVEEGRLRIFRPWPSADAHCLATWPPAIASAPWPRVEIVTSHAGADGALVDALLAPRADGLAPVRGIVVAGTGNGTVHHRLLAALERASAQGVAVARTTRCAYGQVLGDTADGSQPNSGLSPVKARIRLSLALMQPG